MLLVEVQKFNTGTKCGIGILHQRNKKAKTKSQKALGANFNVFRSDREKTRTLGEIY